MESGDSVPDVMITDWNLSKTGLIASDASCATPHEGPVLVGRPLPHPTWVECWAVSRQPVPYVKNTPISHTTACQRVPGAGEVYSSMSVHLRCTLRRHRDGSVFLQVESSNPLILHSFRKNMIFADVASDAHQCQHNGVYGRPSQSKSKSSPFAPLLAPSRSNTCLSTD
jgi:hypothetical protein